MLQSVMGAPLLAWLANALFDSGVGRFFLVCHDRYVEAARACLPAEAEVMTTMDSDPADLLHVFLSTAEDAEHTITVVTGPAVYLPQLAPQAAARFPRVYGVSREELMQALDEHFSFARFLLDNGSPMNEEQAMYSVASPAELPEIAGLLQRNRLLALARTGVEIYDASSCYVEPSVRVAPGARLLPGTMLRGKTVIGEEAVIGPWSVIDDSVIGARAVVNASQVRDSRVGQDAVVGPYASVRGGCELGRSVRAGSFVELNDATHLTPELSTLGRQNWWRGSRYLDFNMWYRGAAPEDAPLLAALGCPQTEPGDRVRIAMLRDTPAGMVATRRLDGDEGALLHLALLPEHRGCGLAAQLLGEAICPLRAGGAKHLRLLRPVTDKGTKRLLATYGITDGCSIVPTEE